MNIPITLNGEKIIIQSDANTSLLTVLRKQKLFHVKRGCEQGTCGSCTVLLDNKPVPSCKVPIALAINSNIETLEYFSKTDTYQSIIKGFSKAGIKLCGYCNAGKIFAAMSILQEKERPNREEIIEQVKYLSPCCTDTDSLTDGILYAYELNSKKEYTNQGEK